MLRSSAKLALALSSLFFAINKRFSEQNFFMSSGDSEEHTIHKHWAEWIVDRLGAEKQEPFVVASGITPSGVTHMGTLCEFLFPGAVHDFLKMKGKKSRFVFVADIMDSFDSIPVPLEKHRAFLAPHLGKPLAHIPDPEGCHKSLGHHFLSDIVSTMEKTKCTPEVLPAEDLYAEGKYDSYAVLFFKNFDKTKELYGRTSMRPEMPRDWSPIMPFCGKCGKSATTAVTRYEIRGEDVFYEYSCTKDAKYVKGCGFNGSNLISDRKYKLLWRLDWPARQDFLGVSCEGGGVDHHTRGGSWDTAQAVHKEIFNKEPPVGFRFGFVLLDGKKYSKSKGIGLSVSELLQLVPPELIKYVLLRPDLEENVDFNPTGETLMRVFDDFTQAGVLVVSDSLSRADRKRAIAFSLSADKLHWKASFADVLMVYQLYRDWEKVSKLLEDPEGVAYLRPFIEQWLARSFAPEAYLFSFQPTKPQEPLLAKAFADALKPEMKELDVHNLVFEVAKSMNVPPAKMFQALYESLLNKQRGPRLGKLVVSIGVEKVKQTLLGLCG